MKEPAASEAEGEEAGVSTASTKDPSVVSERKGRLNCGGGGDATSSVGPQTVKETVRTGATRTLPGIVKTGVEGVSSDASGSPADPTALAGSSSPCSGEPASTAKHKTEEEEEDGVVKDMPVIHAVGEDVNMESSTSANVRSTKACDTDEQMDTGEDIETKEEGDGDSKKDLNETPVTVTESKDVDQSEVSKDTTTDNVEPLSCKSNEDRIAVSWDVATSSQSSVNTSTNDLDEMMDMGTVDQVEQEAQMQDEEQRSLVEIDTSNSPMLTIVNTVSVDSKSPGAKDLEDKLSVLPQSKEELQSEDKVPVESTERSSPSSSEAASTGKSNTSTVANGLKIATVSSANLENAKQSSQASPAAEDSSVSDTVRVSFSPSLVKVKDEPLDEEYDQALTSNTSTAGIKDEPDTKEVQLLHCSPTTSRDMNESRPHCCDQCGKSFFSKSALLIHQRIHTGEKPYHCDQCGTRFRTSGELKRHQRIHTGEKPYYCDQCGTRFRTSGELKRHQRIHTGEKPYHCDQCEKRFSESGHLKKHQRIHTGEKPYHCDQCEKSFSRYDKLKTHQRIHTGEKPYHCDQCEKRFSESGHLKTHQCIHTGEKPYHCDQCEKIFSRYDKLKRHQRIHTGEKPYHCDQCENSFSTSEGLKRHQRIHTGEKPYHCDQCEKIFSRYDKLKKHQRIHTGEKLTAVNE